MAERRSGVALDFKTILAFAAIYIVWGSTFFAIRVLVRTVPVFLAAGSRFAIAGLLMLGWLRWNGGGRLSRLEWKNASVLGALLFLFPYGGLFWAEKTLPSGVASVLVATIPLWTVFLEGVVFKATRLRTLPLLAISLGFAGVVVVATGGNESGRRFALLPCLALMGSTISWSLGTVVSKKLKLPQLKALSSAGQMLTGGALLLLFSSLTGEFRSAPRPDLPALVSLIYLITAGSIAGFTAYTWLLGRLPATTVASYAYVNPVVALLLGHVCGGEAISGQTLWGSAIIVVSVVLLLSVQRIRSAPMSASVSVRT
ncbi:MAG: EamA family transporter [Bryobacteraceae bacterium]